MNDRIDAIAPTDIAIIGMSCRFPGANDIESFWRNLVHGVESVTVLPGQEPAAAGAQAARHVQAASSVSDIEQFDAPFFGYTPREAELMDPQQRLFLECAWEALESAGRPPDRCRGQVGVYAGAGMNTYLINNVHPSRGFPPGCTFLASADELQVLLGSERDFLPTRVSYKLNLLGPSVNVQTACSTALVAVHLACQGLLNGECDLALAGAATVLTPQGAGYFHQPDMIWSSDGHCRAFDARADGTVFGNGVGVVALKLLSEALADGDPIQAVIKGSAVNNDGGVKAGFTAPSVEGQARLIGEALAIAGVDAGSIGYVEAHGTGTALGDPMEVAALTQIFRQHTQARQTCAIGSVKTNLGHLGWAAGIAGLIKTVLALKHRQIPATLHFSSPNPKIDFTASPFYVNPALIDWRSDGAPRRAGVSAFGMGGTNAHIVLEEAPPQGEASLPEPAGPQEGAEKSAFHLLALSARNGQALQDLAARYQAFFSERPAASLADVCHTANTGRSHFEQRAAFVAESTEELRQQLGAFAQTPPGDARSAEASQPGKIAFLFTGQGSQYLGMGRELYATQPTFRRALERCDEILRPLLGESLLELLYPSHPDPTQEPYGRSGPCPRPDDRSDRHQSRAWPAPTNATGSRETSGAGNALRSLPEGERIFEDSSRLDQTAYTQPALFALEYALAELWKSWGVEPDAVLGHSVGEYVAACVAGVFSLEDGLKLVAARGRLMGALPAEGAMAAVLADAETVAAAIQAQAGVAAIAAVNAPGNVVISGERKVVEAVSADLAVWGIEVRPLNVSHAFHSPLMLPMIEEFGQIAQQASFSPPRIKLISNLTGKPIAAEIATPDYWRRHILQPVQFQAGIETLANAGIDILLEVGPKPTLLGLARQCLDAASRPAHLLPSLCPGQDDGQTLLASLGELYTRGWSVDWAAVEPGRGRRLSLPTYPFQRQRYWIDPPDGKAPHSLPVHGRLQPLHPLLTQRLQLAGSQNVRFEAVIDPNRIGWVKDHCVFGTTILPGAAYAEMALAAGALALRTDRVRLEQLNLRHALRFPENQPQTVQVVLSPVGEGIRSFHIYSLAAAPGDPAADATWVIHAEGMLAAATQPAPSADLAALQARCTEAVSAVALYQRYQDQGMAYGPSYRVLRRIWRDGDAVLGEIAAPAHLAGEVSTYQLHPVLFDAGMQLLEALAIQDHEQTTLVPVGLDSLEVHAQPSATLWAYARLRAADGQSDAKELTADLQLISPDGRPAATVRKLRLKRVGRQAMLGERQQWRDWLYEMAWQARPQFGLPPSYLPAPAALHPHWSSEFRAILAQMPELAPYGAAFDQLEALSLGHVAVALGRLGACWQLGSQWRGAALAAELGVVPQHLRLFGRMLGMLAEAGILRDRGEFWEVVRHPDPLPQGPHEPAGSLAQAELALLTRCGEKLDAVLRGAQDPLELLFPGGDASLLNQLYQNSLMGQPMHRLVRQVVATAIARLPADRGLRVLEVGAGTGSTTAYLLPHLPAERTEYVFTDISPSLLRQAQTRFQEHAFVHYQTLNIENAPATQGFALHQYDLVVAANVLHATQDLHQTLTHVRQLLVPGGWLVLLEETAPTRWVDLTFGLTDGWWRFTDLDARPAHPLASAQRWQTLLKGCGFATAAALDDGVAVKGGLGQVVIAAQADAAITPQARAWLILADAQGTGEALAAQLEQRGETAVLVFAGAPYRQLAEHRHAIDPDSPADYQRVVRSMPEVYGVVHLWSLDLPPEALALSGLTAARKTCGSLLQFVQTLLREGGQPPALWLATRDAQAVVAGDKVSGVAQSPLWGMGKVIALEHPELRCVCVDLDPGASPALCADALAAELAGAGLAGGQREEQVAFRQGGRHGARLTRRGPGAENLPAQPFRLEIGEPGLLDSLQLRPATRRQPAADEVEIRVYATGMNFRDVLGVLLGLFLEEAGSLGTECAGVVVAVGDQVKELQAGDAVIAMAAGCFSQYLTVKAERVYHKPPSLSFAEAASIGDAFSTADHCLRSVARIGPGDRVLIHAAAGGVGLAAVQLAQQVGAEVFATASPGKWAALKSCGVRQVYNSRTLDFARQILADTHGRGVDIVLNSLTGEGYIEKNLSVLATGGRFVEISKRDAWDVRQVAAVRPDVEYSLVDLDEVAKQQPEGMRSLMLGLLDQFNRQRLKPLPRTEFPMHDVVNAFRHMQQARHIGKIVVTQPVEHDVAIRGDGVYLITGGLGGLGLLLARWLVGHGARHLLLMGRGQPGPAARACLAELEQAGVQVMVAQADVGDAGQVAGVLATLDPARPLRGVVHAAGVLDDGTLLNQNWERFARVLSPKVMGAWHLHTLTRGQPLDFFVLFSSVTGVLGNLGQANHAAANAFLDLLAHHRRAQHLPALSIAWGAWAEVGAAAGFQAHLQSQGMGMIAPGQGIEVFAHLLRQDLAQASVSPMEWAQFCRQFGSQGAPAFLRALARQQPNSAPLQAAGVGLRGELEKATPRQRRERLLQCVREEIARAMGLRQLPPPQQGFFDLGVDSLMTIEVRNRLQARLEMALASTLLFTYPTIQDLTDFLANQFAAPEPPTATHGAGKTTPEPAAPADMGPLSPDELESLISAELEQLNTLLNH